MKWKKGDKFVVKLEEGRTEGVHGEYYNGCYGQIIEIVKYNQIRAKFFNVPRPELTVKARNNYAVQLDEIQPLTKLHKVLL